MDRQSLIRHLRAWVDGYDPATGAALPLDHPAQRADTLRVLFATIAHLGSAVPAASASHAGPGSEDRESAAPRNAGRPWTPEDDVALGHAFDAGASIAALAEGLQRTRGAINARLVKLGRIEPPPGLRLRGADGTRSEPVAAAPAPDQRA